MNRTIIERLNILVKTNDILYFLGDFCIGCPASVHRRCHEVWSSRGAKFITEPKVHATEMRWYMRDPDGYLIEVGQTTMTAGPLDMYA